MRRDENLKISTLKDSETAQIPGKEIDEFLTLYSGSERVTETDIAKFLEAQPNSLKVKTFRRFLQFTLLYRAKIQTRKYVEPGTRRKIKEKSVTLIPNRIRENPFDWCKCLQHSTENHKPFLARILFNTKKGPVCHPVSKAEVESVSLYRKELDEGVVGRYGPAPIYTLVATGGPVRVPFRRGRERENVLLCEKLDYLGLIPAPRTTEGFFEFDLDSVPSSFKHIPQQEFNQRFTLFSIKNDFKIQRYLVALFMLERLEPELRDQFSTMHVNGDFTPTQDSLLREVSALGPATLHDIYYFFGEYGNFIEHFYYPPQAALKARCYVYLSSQLCTLFEIRRATELTHLSSGYEKEIRHLLGISNDETAAKIKTVVDYLKIDPNKKQESCLTKIERKLISEGKGCTFDLNYSNDSETRCPSNIFVLSKILPTESEFEKCFLMSYKRYMDDHDVAYYPSVRFHTCRNLGISRTDFDNMFVDMVKRKRYKLDFYAVGVAVSERSHTISPVLSKVAPYMLSLIHISEPTRPY